MLYNRNRMKHNWIDHMTGDRINMLRYLRLTYLYVKKTIKGMMSYRWSFLINCISQAMDYGVTFLLMWIMVSAFEGMDGWNAYEVMLLYAFSLFSYGIAGTFFLPMVGEVPEQIRQGTFDDVLVKPVKVLPYLIARGFICNYIAHISLSVVVMTVCFHALEVRATLWTLVRICGILFFGSLIYSGFFLFVGGSAFLVTKNGLLFRIMYFFREVSYYPISIFPRVIQVIVTLIVPYGFINFYPLQELLGKEGHGIFRNPAFWTPVAAVSFFTVACLFFEKSVKCYKSSGS